MTASKSMSSYRCTDPLFRMISMYFAIVSSQTCVEASSPRLLAYTSNGKEGNRHRWRGWLGCGAVDDAALPAAHQQRIRRQGEAGARHPAGGQLRKGSTGALST